MQIDKLQIELRPRTHAQALDLGFALLRSHAAATYKAFLALWLPLVALCVGLTILFPDLAWVWGVMAWWFRPLLERAPLYVLSRQVFGTTVTWQEAVRAWPSQLRGGALYLLTYGRFFAAGRGLMQPVWQLEMARGGVASMRRRVMSAGGTGAAAFWFGIVCVMLEVVLELGLIVFLLTFSGDGVVNPIKDLFGDEPEKVTDVIEQLTWLGAYAVSAAITAPIYTACCFTLYLNRRASLEAWDLEIQLRQIRRPALAKPRAQGARAPTALSALTMLTMPLAGALLAFSLSAAPDAMAEAIGDKAVAATSPTCVGPKLEQPKREAPANARQAQVRRQIDLVYQHKHLRGFECVQTWQPKPDKVKDKKDKERANKALEEWLKTMPRFGFAASVFKVVFIALAIGVVAFLLYRYRDHFPAFSRAAPVLRATEVGGLDIRAESLPPEVTSEVRALWARGERRAALALLYRATLSRLVSDDGLSLRQGYTEGNCLSAALRARDAVQLGQGRLDILAAATTLWLSGAYGDRWPATDTLQARCAEWDLQFGAAREQRA